MEENQLIKKYLAWMIMFGGSNPLSLLTCQEMEDGKTLYLSYVPLINKTVYGIDEDMKTAFKLFFKAFDKAIEKYIKDKSEIRKKFRKQFEKTDPSKVFGYIEEECKKAEELLDDLEKEFIEEDNMGEA